jgi:hypothetical protein
MSILGRLLGTEKAIDNLLDKDEGLLVRAGGWIDGLSHTDQEKAEDVQKTRDWGIRQLEAIEPFKVVQRILAFAAASFWIIVGINVLVAMWVEAAYPEFKIADDMKAFAMSDYVFWPVVTVFALYFGGGVINSLRGGKP